MTDGLGIVIDWIEKRDFIFECDEDVNDAFERIDNKWEIVGNRFSITKLLGLNNEMPDLMLYLQERIDEECEDTTEQITFDPTRAQEDEVREREILETEIELTQARLDLAKMELAEFEAEEGGIINRVKSFIRNIFGG